MLLLVSCAEDRPELSGGLYFAAGGYLAELDLRNGDTRVVTSLGDDTIVELAPQGDERLLLTVLSEVNRQDVHSVVLYDLPSKQLLRFFDGKSGRYLPGTKTLVYDDGAQVVVRRRTGEDWETIEVATHPLRVPVQIVPISDSAFLFAIGGGSPQLYALDTAPPTSPGLAERCTLDAALWVAEFDALLCRRTDKPAEYAFVSLDGEIVESLSLPAGRPLRAVAYAADQGIVILTEQWQSLVGERPKYAIWIHHRDTGRSYRLVDNQHLGETVVYRP